MTTTLSGELLATIGILNKGLAVKHHHNDMSLHKLLYNVRGWVLALRGEEIFPERLSVFRGSGPVVKELIDWGKNLNNGEGPVRHRDGTSNQELLQAISKSRPLPHDHEAIVDAARNMTGFVRGNALSEQAKRDWSVRNTEVGDQVDDGDLKRQFVEELLAIEVRDKVIKPVLKSSNRLEGGVFEAQGVRVTVTVEELD